MGDVGNRDFVGRGQRDAPIADLAEHLSDLRSQQRAQQFNHPADTGRVYGLQHHPPGLLGSLAIWARLSCVARRGFPDGFQRADAA